MGYYLEYILARCVTFLFNTLPASFSVWCGKRAGDIMFFCAAKRRRIALGNIHQAFGGSLTEAKKRAIAREAFRSIALSVIELFTIRRMKMHVNENFTILGNQHLEKAFGEGKGIVLVISHLGSWEYLSFLPYLTGKSWAVVVKKIKNPYLNRYIENLRRVTTVAPIDKNNAVRPIFTELKQNHGVAILIDQWSGPEGLWLDFFNAKTSTTSIPARLAKKTGCALIPAYCLRKEAGKYEIHIHPPVPFNPIEEHWEEMTTQKLNSLLEEEIRKNPGQWLWGHRRWKKRPSQIRTI